MFTTSTTRLRLDLLIRTSHRKKEAKSPKQQRDLAESCAAVHGYDIVFVHDSGKSESGKTMDRAGIHAAMQRVRDGETDGVIVALTDRVGRAPIEEAMTMIRELDSIGGVFVPADGGGAPIDLSDPQAETNLVLQLQMARQFWLASAKRFKQSQSDAVARGVWIGPTPFGYRRMRKGTPLVVDESTGPIVTEAFRIGATDGMHAVIAYLNERVPERRWRTDEVRRLLRCRAYLGEVKYGDLYKPDTHDALTTPALWHAAQTEPKARRASGTYMLSGIATCATCGEPMVGQHQTMRGQRYRRMNCNNPDCGHRVSIGADALERHVRDELKEAVRGNRIKLRFVAGDLTAAKDEVERRRAEVTRYSEDSDYRDIVGDEAWRAGARTRAEAVVAAQADYERIAAENGRVIDLPTPAQLDDDSKLVRFITSTGIVIRVEPGRRAITERVFVIDPLDGDDRVGVLAA